MRLATAPVASRRRLGLAAPLGALIVSTAAAGCGGSSHSSSSAAPGPVAQRVCASVQKAASSVLSGPSQIRVADTDPSNIECVLTGHKARLDVVAQATPDAWTEWDTESTHQAQAFGPGSVHVAGQLPQLFTFTGGQAAWIPAQNELIATNGTESSGGSYLTVKVTHTKLRRAAKVALTRAVAQQALSVAPRGSSPGPAPS